MIKELNHKSSEIAETIVKLQKASYKAEAEIIGYDLIPPLLENAEDIRNSEESYAGYFVENQLAGMISYLIKDGVLDIYKVAVHPDYFRRGIARQLLHYVEHRPDIVKIVVSTGLKNDPATALYLTLGFLKVFEREVAEGVWIAGFEKHL